MKFDDLHKLLESPEKELVSLSIGRCKLIDNLPTKIYDFKDAPLSSVTRKNLEILKNNRDKLGTPIEYDKVYIVDKSNGRNALSYYITGKMGNQPFIYGRYETSGRQSGQTSIYFEKGKYKATTFVNIEKHKDEYCIRGKYFTKYYKDTNGKILHRLDGPAIECVDPFYNHWYIDGREISEDEFLVLTKNFNPEDRQQASNLLKI